LDSNVSAWRQRRRGLLAGAFVLGLGLSFYFWVEHEIAWLKAQNDPYGLEVLSREPDGIEEFIHSDDGARLHSVSKGSGTPVVLVHGLSISLLEWNILWPLLADGRHRVIAFDLRGHGKSTVGSDGMTSAAMARDIARVLEHYNVDNGVLVGHSLGGFVSTVFLTDHPEIANRRFAARFSSRRSQERSFKAALDGIRGPRMPMGHGGNASVTRLPGRWSELAWCLCWHERTLDMCSAAA
jgi:pimeloyl-ACP methyl ester carboxylesterase